MQERTKNFENKFLCTEEEFTQAETLRDELIKNHQVSTYLQAVNRAIDFIKSERKKKKEQEKTERIQSKIDMYDAFGITCDDSGKVKNVPENYTSALKNHPNFKKFRLEEFSDRIFYGDEEMSDFTLAIVSNMLGNIFEYQVSDAKVYNAAMELANQNRFHVVKEYLESLTWDKKKRIPTMFTDFLGAPDCRLHQAQAVIFMVAAVKRIYEPGCKFDNMIILSGPQGIGKSNFCEKLSVNPEWYTENIMLGDKDGYQQLLTSWIVNMDEITSLNKKDAATAKNFITSTADKFRVSYGRFTKSYPRHCVFIGTTNEEKFLKDSTSLTERRYWPVQCSGSRQDSIDRFNKMTPDYVNQLWAEAMFYYNKGNCKIPMYIPEALWKEFIDDQMKYKSDSDSELFDFLSDALNRDYVDFTNDSSLSYQYKNPGTMTGSMKKQDRFSQNAVNILVRENHLYAQRGYLKLYAELHADEWEFKAFKTNGKTVRGLCRIGKPSDDAMKNTDNLFAV